MALSSVEVTTKEVRGEIEDSAVGLNGGQTWTVVLFYYEERTKAGSVAEVGHWTVGVWNTETRELYHFDALRSGREARQVELRHSWTRLLRRNDKKGAWALVQAPQQPKMRSKKAAPVAPVFLS